jgi:carboxymethylenebutenolidase
MMEGSSLSDTAVINEINSNFIPIHANLTEGRFPDELTGLKGFKTAWKVFDWLKWGFVATPILSPDGTQVIAYSGSGFAWEWKTATGYHPDRFLHFLKTCSERHQRLLALSKQIAQRKSSFDLQGTTIPVDEYLPVNASGKIPAVVFLHGEESPASGTDNDLYNYYAKSLAASGYAVFVPHYFNYTKTTKASLGNILANYQKWNTVVAETVSYVGSQKEVDANRINLLGYSLGGALAISRNPEKSKVRSVVEIGASSWAVQSKHPTPPLLILHGKKDKRVNVAEANKIEARVAKQGTVVEKVLYDSEDHKFGIDAENDALTRITAFLAKYQQ